MLDQTLNLDVGRARLDGGGLLETFRAKIYPSDPAAMGVYAYEALLEEIFRRQLAAPSERIDTYGPKPDTSDHPLWRLRPELATGMRRQVLRVLPAVGFVDESPLGLVTAGNGLWEFVLNQISHGVLRDVSPLDVTAEYNQKGSLWCFAREHSSTRADFLVTRMRTLEAQPFAERLRWERGGLELRGRGLAQAANLDAPGTEGHLAWHVNWEDFGSDGLRTWILFSRQDAPLDVTRLDAIPSRTHLLPRKEVDFVSEAAGRLLGVLDLYAYEISMRVDGEPDLQGAMSAAGIQGKTDLVKAHWVYQYLLDVLNRHGLSWREVDASYAETLAENAQLLGIRV